MATPEDARRANRSLLLRTLHRDGPLSRADLAKVTGLTRATVSAVVRDLLDDAVVEELGLSTAGGVGKPATLVDVAADGRHVLCLDLSEPARFVGAIVNLAGKVVVRRTYDRKSRTGRSAVTLVRRICRELVADAERPLLGIGVASPGIVDADGVVVTAAHLGWAGVPLGADLAAEFALPVAVVNDANAAALAELTFGEQTAGNLVCVRVDEGVGAGLVLDGRLFAGSTYAAGEIGHVVVVPDGALCACGKRGCLETEVSEPLLAGRLEADAGDGTAVLERAGRVPRHRPGDRAQRARRRRRRPLGLRRRGHRDVPRRRGRCHRRSHDAGPRRPPRRARQHVRLRRHRRRGRRPDPRPRARDPMTVLPHPVSTPLGTAPTPGPRCGPPTPPPAPSKEDAREQNTYRADAGGAGHREPARRGMRRRRR